MTLLRLKKPHLVTLFLFSSLENVKSVNCPRREWIPSDNTLFKRKLPQRRKRKHSENHFALERFFPTSSQLTKYKSAICILEFENNIFTRKSNANSNLPAKRHVFRILCSYYSIFFFSIFKMCSTVNKL